ncbi:hypothetical protein CYLTODRAFT_357982, partial [Cylindrobasidium torrendii FP15055 ss-10]
PTLGLYSALRACRAMVFKSRRQSRLTVATMFCNVGTIPSTAVMCCCSSVSGTGVGAAAGVDGPASAFWGEGAEADDAD